MASKIRQARMQKNSSTSEAPPKTKLSKAIEPANFFGQTNVIKGTYRMITPSRFEVDVPYYQPLIELNS
ncbi:hypothetical protein PV325_011592 [Microctonus aethiopoides]|nr:hypothetical protein PV325_011592 [Microctonus aethiopoides]